MNNVTRSDRCHTSLLFPVVVLCGLFSLATGCQTQPPVNSTPPAGQAPLAQESRTYHTFAVAVLPVEGSPNDVAAPQRLAKPAEDAVVAAMMAKGYKLADPSVADLLVLCRGTFSPDGLVPGYQERTFALEIHDNRTQKALWREERSRSSSETWSPEILQNVIGQMLQVFPAVSTLNPQ